jgi:hypothetical protein
LRLFFASFAVKSCEKPLTATIAKKIRKGCKKDC